MTDKFTDLIDNVTNHLLKASTGSGNKFNINDYTTAEFKKLVEEKDGKGITRRPAGIVFLHSFDRASSIVRMAKEINKKPIDYYSQELKNALQRNRVYDQIKTNYEQNAGTT